MAHRVPITVRLDSFEGPLDLLLYLIQSHELDINKVSISRITDQFVAYVRLMQELNFDTASEFLVMAATLVHWKSKSLLPDENKQQAQAGDDEEMMLTPEELIRQLREHQRFQAAGESLAQLPRFNEDVFSRPNRRPPTEKVWKTMDPTTLAVSYQDQLARMRKRTQVLRKETVSLADKIVEFSDRLELGKPTEIRKIMSEGAIRPEIVVTFLAALELSRLKKMRVHQEATYGPLYLELLEALRNFDLDLAKGFEYDNQPKAPATPPAPPEGLVQTSASSAPPAVEAQA